MGVPVTRRCDEGAARFPVDPLGVADRAIGGEFGAHQGETARRAINDQIEGHRLMPVRGLGGSSRHHPEHGPEHMGHGAGGGQFAIGQQQTEPVALGAAGIGRQVVQFCLEPVGGVVGGLKARLAWLHPQIAEQGAIVHPVENAGGIRLQQGISARRQHEQIPRRPAHGHRRAAALCGAFAAPASREHKEQRAGGPGGGLHPFARLDAHKVGGQSRAGGRSLAADVAAEIEGDHAAGAAGMQLRAPLAVGDGLGQPLAHRIGRLAVIKQLGFARFPDLAHAGPSPLERCFN